MTNSIRVLPHDKDTYYLKFKDVFKIMNSHLRRMYNAGSLTSDTTNDLVLSFKRDYGVTDEHINKAVKTVMAQNLLYSTSKGGSYMNQDCYGLKDGKGNIVVSANHVLVMQVELRSFASVRSGMKLVLLGSSPDVRVNSKPDMFYDA